MTRPCIFAVTLSLLLGGCVVVPVEEFDPTDPIRAGDEWALRRDYAVDRAVCQSIANDVLDATRPGRRYRPADRAVKVELRTQRCLRERGWSA